jgi:hypothetical protein
MRKPSFSRTAWTAAQNGRFIPAMPATFISELITQDASFDPLAMSTPCQRRSGG